MPNVSASRSVSSPPKPRVAIQAKARVTPPNWASTPQTESTARRIRLVGGAVTTRYASIAPRTAPTAADDSESTRLSRRAAIAVSLPSAWTRSSVKPPSSAWKAPTATVIVGTIRKIRT